MFCSPFGKKLVFDVRTAEASSISGSGRWSKTKRLFFPRKRKSYLQQEPAGFRVLQSLQARLLPVQLLSKAYVVILFTFHNELSSFLPLAS